MTVSQDLNNLEDQIADLSSLFKNSYFDSNLGSPVEFLELVIGQAEDIIFYCKKLQKTPEELEKELE